MNSRRGKSARRLVTSRERLKPFSFLPEISLGSSIVAKLAKLGFNVEPHKGNFALDASDVDWIARAGKMQRSDRKKKFIILTKDKSTAINPLEKSAIISANLRYFIITAGGLTGPEVVKLVCERLPEIADVVEQNEPPFIARIRRNDVIVAPSESL